MAVVTFSAEDLRDPKDSAIVLIGEEDAAHCDGIICGKAFWADDVIVEPGPHHHTTIKGLEPETTRRYFAILPEQV